MSKISHAYAKSLFEIGKEENQLEQFQEDLATLQQVFTENEQFSQLDHNDQKKLLVDMLTGKVPLDILHFLEVLIDNGRFHHLNEIINDFHYLVNDYFGIVEAVVTTPVDLETDQLAAMTRLFGAKLNKEVRIKTVLDPSLIGGYRVSIGDKVYDNSIKTQLKTLEKQMLMN